MGTQTLEFKRVLGGETFHRALSNMQIRELLQNTYKILSRLHKQDKQPKLNIRDCHKLRHFVQLKNDGLQKSLLCCIITAVRFASNVYFRQCVPELHIFSFEIKRPQVQVPVTVHHEQSVNREKKPTRCNNQIVE